MNKKIIISIVILVVIVVVAGALVEYKQPVSSGSQATNNTPAPLLVISSAPIGLIGTVTSLGTSTLTITGQPPGNTVPVVLTVLVDANTVITKVGPAPDYATSTAKFSDFKEGMLLNIAATAVQNGVRHAERIIIPPSMQ